MSKRNDEEFHSNAEKMFQEKLDYEEVEVIRIKDVSTGEILENLNYKMLRFDANLNIYKVVGEGRFEKMNPPNYKAVFHKKAMHKKTPAF